MSERPEVDPSRVIKNPLLSVSVTGLTFEDFPNKPLLLPAAPPLEKAPDPDEAQKSVTVGQKPEIDTETLSEINLSSTADDDYLSSQNDQLIQESTIQDGSILSQAASSFSQLPSVASTVLSTFSKVIKEYSPTSGFDKKSEQSENTQELISPIGPPSFSSDSNSNYQGEPNPPIFYPTSDVSLPKPISNPPPLPGNINSYRLSAKKKTYAQIPGLSQALDKPQILNPLDFNKNVQIPQVQSTLGGLLDVDLSITEGRQPENQNQYKADEQTEGLFAYSKFVPSSDICSPVIETTSSSFPPPPPPSVTASSLNIISNSTNNNERTISPITKIEDTNILNVFKPKVPSEIHPTTENIDFPKQLNVIPTNTPNLQKPPSKNVLGSSGGNTFRLQKGTRLYKNALVPQSAGETAAPVLVPQFPSIFGEQSQLSSTPVLDYSNSSTFSEGNKKVQATVESISIFNPISPPQTVPAVTQHAHFNEPTELPLEESRKDLNVLSESNSNSIANAIKSIPINAGYGKDYLKDESRPDNLTITETNSLKPKVSSLPTLEKPTLVEQPVSIFSEPQVDLKPSTNLFENLSKATPAVQLSGFLGTEPAILTIQSPVQTSAVQSQDHSRIDELSKSLTQQSPAESFNLSNYFNKFNSAAQQQIPATTESNYKVNEPFSETVEVSLTNSRNVVTSPVPINTPASFSVSTSLKTEEKVSSNISANVPALDSDPLKFFDSFHNQTIQQTTQPREIDSGSGLRIQDFFNNPSQHTSHSESNVKNKLVSGEAVEKQSENLLVSNSDRRTLSPTVNIVESLVSNSDHSTKINTDDVYLFGDDIPNELLDKSEMAGLLGSNSSEPYTPVSHHWFYKNIIDTKHVWAPFSHIDSKALEDNYLSGETLNNIVAVEGGRYDVKVAERTRVPVYWTGESTDVRRCSWFYKAADSKYIPYEEAIADLLEEEYKEAWERKEWHRKIALPTGETVVFHGPTVIVHFLQSQVATDTWANTSQTTARPRIVRRGIEDFDIESGESATADHLLFMVHGVGSACDLRFRPLEEVVDEFRSIALQLVQSHYKNSCNDGVVNRIEVLPVSWHSQLHSKESGIDEKLKAITLESIPKLRNFTNDTLLDILFYTSPVFCQNIMNTVCEALNNIFIKYCQRNPAFKGGVSLAGHSLGSLILFDLLCHQRATEEMEIPNSENPDQIVQPLNLKSQTSAELSEPLSQQVSYTVGTAGTGQPFINYPQLIFHPKRFFALGSPVGMFVTIRGIETLGLDFKLPTCPNFFHIFHPYDPVAYRIEPLINPELSGARPVLIPHHKGRKRMHLELKETMTRVGADLKQKVVDAFKNTLDSVNFLSSRSKVQTSEEITKEVDKVLEMQLKLNEESPRSRTDSTSTQSDIDMGEVDLPLGVLNNNRRIDYVLQEAPLEFFNEYLFAFASHVCYWESEDTILFITKEVYSSLGIRTDSQIPQQSMTIERPNTRTSNSSLSPST